MNGEEIIELLVSEPGEQHSHHIPIQGGFDAGAGMLRRQTLRDRFWNKLRAVVREEVQAVLSER